jgi:hypothetical protein
MIAGPSSPRASKSRRRTPGTLRRGDRYNKNQDRRAQRVWKGFTEESSSLLIVPVSELLGVY